MISGSIGLHHVLTDFTPINDLWQVEVGPLRRAAAEVLAARLLLGIGVHPTRRLVDSIVQETSATPYYVHAVVDQLRYRDDLAVSAVVATCLAENLWQTDHYVTRLLEYFGPERVAHVRALLDVVAEADVLLDVETVRARMAARDPDRALSRDDTIDLLGKLEKDHYLVREGSGDRMATPLLARIWRHHRRLP